jgi:predicted AlkP superfamily pyrophosphatase or phosphodiesterase
MSKNLKFVIFRLFLISISIALVACKATINSNASSPTINSKISLKKPYVILISLDGFRWDYVEKYQPPHLSNFIQHGVKAASLIPSFPSKTFPNHYTIATGMYPDNHGILGNSFYSYEKNEFYSIRNREMVEDGSFYGGTPIWVQADKAGMVSASYFFVGSEADIQGIRPTYYFPYDGSTKNDVRVAQTLNWLVLPAKNRPHIITMYFSDMDDIGHRFGPSNDEELKKALFNLDKNLGDLFKGVAATGLPVNIIIVSDHGMADLYTSNFIPIDAIQNDNLFTLVDNGAIVNVYPKNNAQLDSVFQFLKQQEHHFKVYKTENTPGFEYIPKNKNWGSIQIIPDVGYYFSSSERIEATNKNQKSIIGVHGYNTTNKDMHGIFYANGTAFKKDYEIPSFKNIHIYPLLCEILELEIPDDIDGNISEVEIMLKNNESQ